MNRIHVPRYNVYVCPTTSRVYAGATAASPLKLSLNVASGYPTINIPQCGIVNLHKIIAMTLPDYNPYMDIGHKDDNRCNFHRNNLEMTTKADNMAQKSARARRLGKEAVALENQINADAFIQVFTDGPLCKAVTESIARGELATDRLRQRRERIKNNNDKKKKIKDVIRSIRQAVANCVLEEEAIQRAKSSIVAYLDAAVDVAVSKQYRNKLNNAVTAAHAILDSVLV